MIVTNLVTELKELVSEDQIKPGVKKPLGNMGEVTVFPRTEEEISSLLKYANDNEKKLSIIGGGTKRGFGGLTESADIELSLSEYKGIVEHTVGDMTLTVKAGTSFKEIQDYLAQYNQTISLDPSWPEHATIGGIIAANESGPKRLGYGSARDVVIGLRTVYPDGTVIRSGGKVVKNVAGYDMNKLFIGSMGTLGVVSEVTVKLRPLPKYESLILLSFPDGSHGQIRDFVVNLLDSMMEPVTLELLSPSLSSKLIDKDLYSLAIGFQDVESSVHYQEEFVKKMQPPGTELTIYAQNEARNFWESFYKIGPNGAVYELKEETEASLKIGVKNLDVLKVIKESELLQDSYNLQIDAHGGIGHGLCTLHLRGASEDILSAIHQLRESVSQLGGYVIIKHLPFALRQKIDVWGQTPSYFILLEGIKSKIDPKRILNPKRFVGGI